MRDEQNFVAIRGGCMRDEQNLIVLLLECIEDNLPRVDLLHDQSLKNKSIFNKLFKVFI